MTEAVGFLDWLCVLVAFLAIVIVPAMLFDYVALRRAPVWIWTPANAWLPCRTIDGKFCWLKSIECRKTSNGKREYRDPPFGHREWENRQW